MSKSLIAWYSRKGSNYFDGKIMDLPVGNTEVIAKKIAALTGAELFHIEAVKPYPADYDESTEVAKSNWVKMPVRIDRKRARFRRLRRHLSGLPDLVGCHADAGADFSGIV